MGKKAQPARYTKKLGDALCLDIACGESLRKACLRFPGLSHTTVVTWVLRNSYPKFTEKYEQARKIADELTEDDLKDVEDEILTFLDRDGNEHVDNGSVQAVRVKQDRIKWVAARKQWRRWGEKPEDTKPKEASRPILLESDDVPDRLKPSEDE